MRLAEDQETPREQGPEPLAKRSGVVLVGEQVVRDQETTVCAPRIHPKPALPAHASQVVPVENLEDQTEAVLELSLPLFEDGRRCRNNDCLCLPPEQKLARDEPGFDRLAEP